MASSATTIAQRQCTVVVIGAGAAGLAAAHELLKEGHSVTVLEKGDEVGGTWIYTEDVEEHPLNGGRRVHSSMYHGLRTNLPREIMGFSELPFLPGCFPGSSDPRQFPGHQEVLCYLQAFAQRFGLLQHIRLSTEVLQVQPLPGADNSGSSGSGPRWEIHTSSLGGDGGEQRATLQADAVVVCNGHFSEPRVPAFPGQDVFPGRQLHSHSYRRPDGFKGQTVVLVGAAFSGLDLAQEIAEAGAAQLVYLCARDWDPSQHGEALAAALAACQAGAGPAGASPPPQQRVVRAPNVAQLHADGGVTLEGGHHIAAADAVIYCTGYVYSFPFLDGTGIVSVDDNRVGPLYMEVFPPGPLAPWLSFIGLPFMSAPFPQAELQARWVARALSGAVALPPCQEMKSQAAAHYAALDEAGVPLRHTHRQPGEAQARYNAAVAAAAGDPTPPAWRYDLYAATWRARAEHGERYRGLPLPGEEAAVALAAAAAEAAAVCAALQQPSGG